MSDPGNAIADGRLLDRSAALDGAPPDEREAIGRAAVELVATLRSHHRGTADHSNRLAARLPARGGGAGAAARRLFELELVAILHDIGKLAVPARILDLARPLNPRERLVVREHTVRGAEILAEIAGLEHLAPLVRASHERWDGTGYPDGLARRRDPARGADRVHRRRVRRDDERPAVPACARRAEARRRISAGAGTAFEPRVTRALLAAL